MKKQFIVLSFILSAVLASAVMSGCTKEEESEGIKDTTTTFYGIVSDDSGNGLPGVTVSVGDGDITIASPYIENLFGSTVTGSDGYFELRIDKEEIDIYFTNWIYLQFEKTGYKNQTKHVDVSLGQGRRYQYDCMMIKQ